MSLIALYLISYLYTLCQLFDKFKIFVKSDDRFFDYDRSLQKLFPFT